MASTKAPTPTQVSGIHQKLNQFYQIFFMANVFFMTGMKIVSRNV